jgi:hypothetical protein
MCPILHTLPGSNPMEDQQVFTSEHLYLFRARIVWQVKKYWQQSEVNESCL